MAELNDAICLKYIPTDNPASRSLIRNFFEFQSLINYKLDPGAIIHTLKNTYMNAG